MSSRVNAQITDPDYAYCESSGSTNFQSIYNTNGIEITVCTKPPQNEEKPCLGEKLTFFIFVRNLSDEDQKINLRIRRSGIAGIAYDLLPGSIFLPINNGGAHLDNSVDGILIPKYNFPVNATDGNYLKFKIEFERNDKLINQNYGNVIKLWFDAKKSADNKFLTTYSTHVFILNNKVVGTAVGVPSLSQTLFNLNGQKPSHFKVVGTFTFDGDFEFVFDAPKSIYMNPDSKIIIKDGNTLTIENTSVITCGQGRWNTIEVESGARLIIKKKCFIEGGKVAIKAKTGSYVVVQESILTNNNIAIDAEEGSFVVIGKNKFLDNTDIGVQFNGIGEFDEFSGNYFESPNGNANVKSNGSIVASTKNTFAACKVGILANKSTIFSKDDVFKNQIFGISSKATSTEIANVTVTGGSFDKCATAMEMQGSGLNCTASNVSNSTYGVLHSGNCDIIAVQNTNFQLVSKGVTLRLSKANKILLDDNKLYSGDVGIQLLLAQSKANVSIRRNQLSEYDKGIYLRHDGLSKTVCDVRKNTLEGILSYGILNQSGNNGTVSNNTLALISGTGIQLNGGSGYILNCNTVGDGNSGIVTNMSTKPSVVCNTTAGSLDGIIFDGTSTGSQVKGNTMRNAVGLRLKESATIGEQQYAGNRWQQNSTAFCENSNSFASRFFVTTNTPNILNPTELLPFTWSPDEWFQQTKGSPIGVSTYQCDTGDNCDNYLAPPDGLNCDNVLDGQIRKNEFTDERFGEVSSWIAKSQLYERLRSDTDCVNGEVQTFLDGLENQSIGHFETLKQNYQLIDNVIATDNLEEQLESLNQEYGNLTSTMIQTTDESALNSLKVQLTAVRVAIQALNSQLESSKVENNNAQNVALDVLASSNDAANYNTEYENDNQLINRIWFTTLARGAELSDEQLSIVYNIANQCPFAAGEVVYRARNIYALSNPNAQFRDNSLCPASARNGKDAFAKLSGITLYPNPASEEVTLSYEKLPANCTFTLLNSLGQPVASFKLDTEGKATIELDRLPAGLYLAQILDHNQVLYSEKLPIQQ